MWHKCPFQYNVLCIKKNLCHKMSCESFYYLKILDSRKKIGSALRNHSKKQFSESQNNGNH